MVQLLNVCIFITGGEKIYTIYGNLASKVHTRQNTNIPPPPITSLIVCGCLEMIPQIKRDKPCSANSACSEVLCGQQLLLGGGEGHHG